MACSLTEKTLFSLGSKFPSSTWHPRQLWQLQLPTLNSSGERSISLIGVKLTLAIRQVWDVPCHRHASDYVMPATAPAPPYAESLAPWAKG